MVPINEGKKAKLKGSDIMVMEMNSTPFLTVVLWEFTYRHVNFPI
jgi:hypothetical protein